MQPVIFWQHFGNRQQTNNSIILVYVFLESALTYTAKRTRPLARRALITAAPLLVFIRTLNPWVRFLFMTDG